MIVAITNLKGGVGKTTSAVALACAASRAGEGVRLIDADPQGSATDWADIAAEENNSPLPFGVEIGNLGSISRLKSKDDEVVVIDCPPDGKVNDAAIDRADFVVIPITPSSLDVRQMWKTVDAVQKRGVPYAVLIVRVDERTVNYKTAIETLEEEEASYFETSIPQREGIKNNFGYNFGGELYGYEKVFEEIREAF